MARIKKYADNLTQNLTYFQTFVTDTNPNSDYFRITEFKETFTGGKNGFLIEGSQYLKESTEIKIEILDVDGNPIYFEPGNGIPEYYEGLSKIVAVYIYEDTPIGNAKITVLGELKTYIDADGVTQPIPDEWAGIYNLKWEREFKINRLLSNEDNVRFYVRPEVSITEIVKPIFSNVVAPKTQSGIINGISQAPIAGLSLANYTSPTSYLLETVGNSFWTGSIVGTYLETNLLVQDPSDPNGSVAQPTIPYRPLVTELINSRRILVQPPYTENGVVANIQSEPYTAVFNYTEGIDNLKTALTGSFAKITLSDLTTFVGDCARVKIFRKSTADLSDFQFVQEIQLESNEILVDLESQIKNQENYGLFDSRNYKEYWVSSSNDLVTSFNQTFLFDSIKLNSTNGTQKFFTTKSFNINEGIEYTLDFNVRKEAVGAPTDYIEAYLSGSKQLIINGFPIATIPVKQSITTLKTQNALLQKQNINENIKAEKIDNAKLYFDVKGNDWHISDISLKASQETAFSPDEITFIQSVPRSLPAETFVYRFEFYDINNNYIPVLVEETKTFNGGNLQTIRKQLRLIASSAGFQFDSGSNPVPPTILTIEEEKTLLTGSVHYTSQSFDFFGNALSSSQYTASVYAGPDPLYSGSGQYPGLLQGIGTNNVFMRVQDFTGSRSDINVQLVRLTGECEGFTDTINIYKILDGFGGVNHIIRPYRGTQIRNSSTSSLEIQAVRIDGINDILLSKQSYKNFSNIQLHIISRSKEGNEKFVNLSYVTASNMILGLSTGSLGTSQIDYNAVFNRDSIDFRRIIYLMPSSSAASGPAYAVSSSVLASIILEDLQDGLDSGTVTYNADSFTINPRTEIAFRPSFAFATASFAKRGSTSTLENVTSSFQVYPSMSINKDWVPEYWLYYHTQSLDPTLTVVATDDNKNIIPSQAPSGLNYVRSPLNQSKTLTLTFTYTEPWTSASVSLDKTFTIVPEGKQGDESIIFEVNPIAVTLGANSRGVVNDFRPSITDIKLKQGSRYLAFSSSAYTLNNLNTHGTFYIATGSIIEKNVKAGNIQFTSSFGVPYTASLIVSASSNFTQLSGSVEYPLIIHPYYTSSIYTASVIINYTKILEGAPPIQILMTPSVVTLAADEVGYVTPIGYSPANTTIQVKEGDDFLTFTTRSIAPGTWRINSIETRGGSFWNIRTGSLSSSSLSTATVNYNRFDHPYVSASALYTIQVYPFALGAGHSYTSSIYTRTQTFTKNIDAAKARKVDFKASSYTVNYNRDGRKTTPESGIDLIVSAFNTTGSYSAGVTSGPNAYLYFVELDGSETFYDGPQPLEGTPPAYTFGPIDGSDAAGPGENKTWKVKLTDGKAPAFNLLQQSDIRAEGQLTISGIKAGADAYKIVSSNDNCSMTANLWTSSFKATGMKITTFKGTQQLTNVTSYPAPTYPDDYDFQDNVIGILGFSSASIFSTSSWITPAANRFPAGSPASIGDIIDWYAPAISSSGTIVYKVDFENDRVYGGRQTQFVTQSISVQFEPPPPYDVKLTNENSSAVYRVSGEFRTSGTGTQVRVYRGNQELTNQPAAWGPSARDAYGVIGYPNQCRISVYSKSSFLTLPNGWLPGSYVTGVPATMPPISNWTDPQTNSIAEVVYQVECEGRQTLYKTQSISIQIEGSTGPGIVMRGEWNNATDYSGSVETRNTRRDAVIYGTNPVTYYAAISGSGPTTYNKSGTLISAQTPNAGGDSAYWQYLGEEEFFVAAKIAIFEESFVKNTINVGNNSGSAFANIVLAGGREDPYMAIGQYANIGYDNIGIWLGIYNDGTGPTQYKPRFSLKNATGTNYLRWTGTALEVSGDLNIVAGGSGNASTQAYANTSASSSAAIALTSAANIANLTASAAFQNAVAKTQQLADGAFPGTFISSNFIYSPVVAGVNGYFSNTFKVGNGGITLDGANKKIFIGTGTYNNANTPFYVDSDNKFSLGNKLFFDGNNLTITGTVTADDGNIGGWVIDGTILRDENSNIKLNPTVPAIEIYDDSDVKRLDIRKGNLSSPGLSGAVTIDPPTFNEEFPDGTYYSYTWGGVGDYRSVAYNSFTPGATGTYVNATPSWGYLSPYADASFGYLGNIGMDIYIEIHNSATPGVGTLVHNIRIGEGLELTGPGDEDGINTINNALSLYFQSGVTYYVFVSVNKYGTIIGGGSSFVDLSGMEFTPNDVTLTLGLNQTELTDEGLLIVQDVNKYAKISRESTEHFINVSQNSATYAGINATNFLGKGNPSITLTKGDLRVLDGRIEFNQPGVDRGFSVNWTKGAPTNYEGQLGQVMDAGQLRPSIRFNGIPGAGAVGGTMRGVEISLANGWIGRNTSSRRFKEDIAYWEHPSVLDVVNSVEVKTFYWKVDAGKDYRAPNIGLIAEELLEAGLEEYVGFEPDRDENGVEKLNPDGTKIMLPYDIDKTGLVFPLWRAVQELSQKVKDLEDKINELNS
jgi:hypothetical protein